MSRAKAALIEVAQFIPIISFALPFIVAGEVDLSTAGTSFYVAAAVAVAVIGGLTAKGVQQNPILVGSGVWLILGALGFAAVYPLEALISQTQAASLFAVILAVGVGFTATARGGFIGMPEAEPAIVRMGSIIMIVLAAAALGWAFVAQDIRLGGGLPFILLNVIRRVLSRQLGG